MADSSLVTLSEASIFWFLYGQESAYLKFQQALPADTAWRQIVSYWHPLLLG